MTRITRRSLVLGAMATPFAPSAFAQPAAGNLFEQFVVAEVHQHRRGAAGVGDPGYRFIREQAQTRLQQTRTARLLRGIGRNGCSAFATKLDRCDSHRARIPFI